MEYAPEITCPFYVALGMNEIQINFVMEKNQKRKKIKQICGLSDGGQM